MKPLETKKEAVEKETKKPEKEPRYKINHKKAHKSGTAYNLVEANGHGHLLDVNLIPKELLGKATSGMQGQLTPVLLAVFVPVMIISVGWGLLYWGQGRLTKSMEEKTALLDSKTKEIGDYEVSLKKNNALAGIILSIKNLRQNKIAWSNFFELLEKYTLNGVYYNNLSMDTSGSLLLPGVADDYEMVAKQLAILNNAGDFIKDAKISNIQTYSEGKSGITGIAFQLRLVLADHVFDLKSK